MDQLKRQELHQHALSFIQSPGFIDYLKILYKNTPTGKDFGALQQSYIQSMQNAKVEMSYVWMANQGLTKGKLESAPALLLSGAYGTEESETYVQSIYEKMGTQDFPSPQVKTQIEEMLRDENFTLGRARTLPLEFTDDYPVYLLDTALTADCINGPNGETSPFIPCLINPEGEVKIFAIPFFVMATQGMTQQSAPSPAPTTAETGSPFITPTPSAAAGGNSPFLNTNAGGSIGQVTPAHPGGAARITQQSSGYALAALITGLVSFLLPIALIPVILGFIALRQISKSNGTITGKGKAITGLILGGINLIIVGAIAYFIITADPSTNEPAPPISGLDQAEINIGMYRDDTCAYGNTTEAEEMAREFSTQMKTMRKVLFEGDDSASISTQGHFLTHCEVHEDSCAFIVNVPRLRKYTDEAKEQMANQSWFIASTILKSKGYENGFKMAVGTKGNILYERIDVGTLTDQTSLLEIAGVKDSGSLDRYLHPFFPLPEEESTPDTTESELSPKE